MSLNICKFFNFVNGRNLFDRLSVFVFLILGMSLYPTHLTRSHTERESLLKSTFHTIWNYLWWPICSLSCFSVVCNFFPERLRVIDCKSRGGSPQLAFKSWTARSVSLFLQWNLSLSVFYLFVSACIPGYTVVSVQSLYYCWYYCHTPLPSCKLLLSL